MTERVQFDAIILTTDNTFIKANLYGHFEGKNKALQELKVDGVVADRKDHPYIDAGTQISVKDVLIKTLSVK